MSLPVEDFLCKQMEKLCVTLKEGYPSRGSDASILAKGQFVPTPGRSKWYSMHQDSTKVLDQHEVVFWSQDLARLNSTFQRVNVILLFLPFLCQHNLRHSAVSGWSRPKTLSDFKRSL